MKILQVCAFWLSILLWILFHVLACVVIGNMIHPWVGYVALLIPGISEIAGIALAWADMGFFNVLTDLGVVCIVISIAGQVLSQRLEERHDIASARLALTNLLRGEDK